MGAEDLRTAHTSRAVVGLFVAIICAGAALRFATLSQSIWFDEAVSVRDVSASFSHMIANVTHRELTPPLYFSLLWLWRHAFGTSSVDMRTLSAVLGTLTIPIAFFSARRLVGERGGLIVAALVASSPAMLYYSQELRAYALVIFLCALAFWAFVALVQSPSRTLFAVWAVLSFLAVAAHYFAVVILVPQAFWLAVRARRVHRWRRPTLIALAGVGLSWAGACVLAAYQYHRAYEYGQAVLTSPFVHQTFNTHTATLGNWLPTVFQDLTLGPGGPAKSAVTIAMMFVILFAVWLLVRAPEEDPIRLAGELNIVLLIPGTVALIGLLLAFLPIQGRYLLPCWLSATIVIAAGLACWRAKRLAVLATIALCAAWVTIGIVSSTVPELGSREDTRGVARALGLATRNRLIAIDQKWDVMPLLSYRRDATNYARTTAAVRELDVVLMPNRGFPADTDAHRPAPATIAHLPAGLVLSHIIRGPTFVIERYRSTRPVQVRLYPGAGSFSARWRFAYEHAGGRVSSL
jgi:uncharacterized membrane protein